MQGGVVTGIWSNASREENSNRVEARCMNDESEN